MRTRLLALGVAACAAAACGTTRQVASPAARLSSPVSVAPRSAADSLRRLSGTSQLKAVFATDSGSVRLVALLSPT